MKTLRTVMIAIPLVLLAATVGAFPIFGLSGGRDVATSTDSAETTVARNISDGRLLITVRPGQEGAFEIVSRLERDDGGNDATLIQPSVSMTMIGHDMGRTPIPMYRRSDGSWNGTGSFPMSGQWRFQVSFDGEIIELDHTAR